MKNIWIGLILVIATITFLTGENFFISIIAGFLYGSIVFGMGFVIINIDDAKSPF